MNESYLQNCQYDRVEDDPSSLSPDAQLSCAATPADNPDRSACGATIGIDSEGFTAVFSGMCTKWGVCGEPQDNLYTQLAAQAAAATQPQNGEANPTDGSCNA